MYIPRHLVKIGDTLIHPNGETVTVCNVIRAREDYTTFMGAKEVTVKQDDILAVWVQFSDGERQLL